LHFSTSSLQIKVPANPAPITTIFFFIVGTFRCFSNNYQG
jgi:hypothetical protein